LHRRFYHLDVFTNKRFLGNPLAVVTDGDGLSPSTMQSIAREMNLSETVFIQKPTTDRALARLRIFTTQQELPLAGHPVIGTWFLLAQLGVVPASEGQVKVLQQTGAGILPVEFSFHDGRPVRVTMTQKPAKFSHAKVSTKLLAEALGLRAADFSRDLPVQTVSTGIPNLMVPLASRAALRKIQSNPNLLQKATKESGQVAYCFALEKSGNVSARGMLPWGIVEDPATGSAGGSLGAYLVRHEKLRAGHTLTITQGEDMGRLSHIYVEVRENRGKLESRVSGSAVLVLEGHIDA
jgi:trans-2,3-dihydro-3-hydroxyanthranilate isomerase